MALKDQDFTARRLLDATLSKLTIELVDLEPHSQQPYPSPFYFSGYTKTVLTGFKPILEGCFLCGLKEHDTLAREIYQLQPTGRQIRESSAVQVQSLRGPDSIEASPADKVLYSIVQVLKKYQPVNFPASVKELFILLFTRYVLVDRPITPPRPYERSHNHGIVVYNLPLLVGTVAKLM